MHYTLKIIPIDVNFKESKKICIIFVKKGIISKHTHKLRYLEHICMKVLKMFYRLNYPF